MTNLIFRRLLWVLLLTYSIQIQAQEEVVLICPESITINCEDELEPLASYGTAKYRIGEELNELENQQSNKNIDDCGKGNIERKWRFKSEDGEEHKCSQFIYIGQTEEGKPQIKWPTKEVVVSWCDPSYKPRDLAAAAQSPTYFEGECNKMEHTYSDEIVYLSEGCKEVHRNWLVHDWCYDSKQIVGNDGHYKFTQVIKFAVPEEITYGEMEDIYVEADDCEKVYVDLPNMEANIEGCNRRVRIKNDSPFAEQSGKNASGTYPVGETIIRYKVELACTKAREFTQRIIVSNPCKEKAIIEEKALKAKLQRSFVRPNPFSQSTEIYFNSTEESKGVLKIRNTEGREVLNKSISIETQGIQKVRLSSAELKLPGVYLYSIQVGERVLEGKLIKIR